jgi:acyl-CoA hydrolase
MIGDSVAELMERGVVTNARKPIDTGVTITGTLIGTRRLYAFANDNPAIGMRPPTYTHSQEVLARLPALISLNSAVEVDLTGQVNAEEAAGEHVGAVGGQVDYVRGAVRSAGGHSFIALPSSAQKGAVSRIVARLSGAVTTARSDVDIVVTEFGAAQLRGRSLPERAKALIAIAAPQFREGLERDAHTLLKILR